MKQKKGKVRCMLSSKENSVFETEAKISLAAQRAKNGPTARIIIAGQKIATEL